MLSQRSIRDLVAYPVNPSLFVPPTSDPGHFRTASARNGCTVDVVQMVIDSGQKKPASRHVCNTDLY